MEFTTRQKNAFAKKKIFNTLQLKRWFPLRYLDNTKETGISDEYIGNRVVVICTLLKSEKRRMNMQNRDYFLAQYEDQKTKNLFRVAYFGDYYRYRTLGQHIGQTFIVAGILTKHPVFGYSVERADITSTRIGDNMKILPVLKAVKGVSEENVRLFTVDAAMTEEEETIPDVIRNTFDIPEINEAVREIHIPQSINALEKAKKRLLFDDLFYFASRLYLIQKDQTDIGVCGKETEITDTVIRNLPFTLTNGQRDVFEKIKTKITGGFHFNALVQGDVGSGKTIIAFLSMILTAENGYQAILMAPTQILAEQHYNKLLPLIDGTGLNAILISGISKPSDEELSQLSSGSYNLIIGTTALLSDKINYCNPGLFVIDEEHKFGVNQRNAIDKRKSYTNCISMSGTPIPRTLASAVYGDMIDVYSIKERPAGRKEVITYYDNGNKTIGFIKKVLKSGHQVYVVCPMIYDNDSDTMKDILSTTKVTQIMNKYFGTEYCVRELTGDTPNEDSSNILAEFYKGNINILVSTTVVEVGIDVPNATLMVICNAERFGLAGIHQLRGRVGRGKDQSYCILMSEQTPAENERLNILCHSNDGFELAEKDMTILRKTGNILGEEQSGKNRFIDEIIQNNEMYEKIKETVRTTETDVLEAHINKYDKVFQAT